jgi:hypothetical protein
MAVTAAFVALLATSFAEAAAPGSGAEPRPGASSVAQYVELIPTASGPKAPGVEKERRAPLSPEAKRALDRAPKRTAVSLLTVATSSTYGTPPRLARASGGTAPDTRATTRSPSRSGSLEAIATAAAPAGDTRMISLLLILAAVTVAAGAFSLRRRL